MTIIQPDPSLQPANFYKYRSMNSTESVERVERIVLHDEVYFASAKSFNDPFDLNPAFSLQASPEQQRADFIRMSRKFNPSLTDPEHEAEATRVMATSLSATDVDTTTNVIQFAVRQHLIESVGAFCVSERCNDLLMWAHYADSHRGVCLEFDGAGGLMASAQQVTYSLTRPAINHYEDERLTMLAKALLTKSAHWAYEAEWRLLRADNGPGVVRFRPENLTGIVVGALATPETIEIVRRWAANRSTPLALRRASVSNREFRLLVEPLR